MGNAQPVIFRISIHIRWYLPDISNTQNVNAGVGVSKKGKAEMIIGNLKPETNIVNHARNSTFQFTHLNFLTWGSDPLNLRSAIMSHPLHKKTATYMTPDSAAEDLLRRSTEAYYLSNCTREPSTLRDTGFVPGTGMNRINFDEQNVFRAK